MSGRYILSPLAQAEIKKLWTHTAKRLGSDQADPYIWPIDHHIQIVADRPSIGRACPDVRAGYQKYPSGSHVLFYRHIKAGIDIARILHERMDIKQHL